MEETARKWMKIIREQEKPDLVIGMFHAGQDAQLMGGKYRENASVEVACNVLVTALLHAATHALGNIHQHNARS